MLNAQGLVDKPLLRTFIFSTQDLRIGGFAKHDDSEPDILHTYFGIAALSIFNEPDVSPIHPALNLPMAAFEHLTRLNRSSK
jgi:geranylgeranyl transferase type-1 subunit beta